MSFTEVFRLNLEFLGNQIVSQKQLLKYRYKNVCMMFVWPRTTHLKFEAQELFKLEMKDYLSFTILVARESVLTVAEFEPNLIKNTGRQNDTE